MEKLILKNNLPAFVVFLILILWRIVNFKTTPELGLDNSWMWYLSQAQATGMIFGKQIIFTWGPLAFLETGVCLTNFQIWFYILYSIYKIGVFTYCFKLISNYYFNSKYYLELFFLVSAIIAGQLISNTETGVIVNLILLIIVSKIKFKSNFILFLSFFILSFFIKFTILFSAIILLFYYIIENRKYINLTNLLQLLGSSIFIFILSVAFKISLFLYFKGIISVVLGYSKSMYFNSEYSSFDNLNYFLFFIIINLYVIYWIKFRFDKLHCVLLSLFLFVVYQSSFVRFDSGHALILLIIIPFILLLILIDNGFFLKSGNRAMNNFLLIFSLFFYGYFSKLKGSPLYITKCAYSFLTHKDVEKCNFHPNKSVHDKIMLLANNLSPAYFNKIFVVPPTPQNYCCYTDYLEDFNYKFYLKGKLKSVCVEAELLKKGIDKRHPQLFNRWFFCNIERFELVDSFNFYGLKYLIFNDICEKASISYQKNHIQKITLNLEVENGKICNLDSILTLVIKLLHERKIVYDPSNLKFEILSVQNNWRQKLINYSTRNYGLEFRLGNIFYTIPEYYFMKSLNLIPYSRDINFEREVPRNFYLTVSGRFNKCKLSLFYDYVPH